MSLLSKLRQASVRRRAMRELAMLDAYMLRDIGLEPVDVYDTLIRRNHPVSFKPARRDHK